MESTIETVADFIKRYKSFANVKFTLGKYTDEFGFENHLFHKEKYESILNLLDSNPNWENKKEISHEKIDICPFKIVDTITYKIKNSPYDLIITAESKKCQDIYISDDYIKKEITFLRKCHTFQLGYEYSISHGHIYSFKINLHTNSNTDTYNSHSSLLKILDIVKVIDKCKTNDYSFEKL